MEKRVRKGVTVSEAKVWESYAAERVDSVTGAIVRVLILLESCARKKSFTSIVVGMLNNPIWLDFSTKSNYMCP